MHHSSERPRACRTVPFPGLDPSSLSHDWSYWRCFALLKPAHSLTSCPLLVLFFIEWIFLPDRRDICFAPPPKSGEAKRFQILGARAVLMSCVQKVFRTQSHVNQHVPRSQVQKQPPISWLVQRDPKMNGRNWGGDGCSFWRFLRPETPCIFRFHCDSVQFSFLQPLTDLGHINYYPEIWRMKNIG